MSTFLRVKDFQSIGNTEIEIDGFTVITGPNNSGKSALVRAVIGLFSNNSGLKHCWVRKGQKHLKVSLDFADGVSVLWERGPKVARYEVNGEALENVGQKLPDEVKELGIHSLKIGSETLWPQIATQFLGQLFLVHQTGSVMAEAIADIERVGKINRALRLGESYRRDAVSKLKVRRSDSEALAAQIHSMQGLDEILARVKTFEAQRTETLGLARKIQTTQILRARLLEAQEAIASLQGLENIQPGSSEKARKCRELLKLLKTLAARLKESRRALERFAGVSDTEVVSPDKARQVFKLLRESQALQTRLQTLQAVLDQTKDLDISLEGDWEAHQKLSDELSKLKGLKTRLKAQHSRQESLTETLDQKEAELAQDQKDVEALLEVLQECPTCGKST